MIFFPSILLSWLQRQLQPSKERTTAHSNQNLKNVFSRKLSSEKKLTFDTESGMVTIVLVNLRSKSLLRKQSYGDFEKEPETP
jgi:hypothetical protein